MSGGSYSYLYCKEPCDLFNYMKELDEMAMRLTELDYIDAAKETLNLIYIVKQYETRAKTILDRMENVFKAVEYYDNCDYSKEDVEKYIKLYRGE